VSVPQSGRPWAPGDFLIRFLPAGFGVPAGWTIASEDSVRVLTIWQRAVQSGHGDPDVYVVPPWMAETITSAVQP
jgi:hypothetical protein